MRRIVFLLLGLTACASYDPVETRVRDPWQVAVVTVTKAGDVPRRGRKDEWRDEEGFPHFESYGDFLITNDGAIVTPEARREGSTIRLLAHLLYHGWCRRSLHPCTIPITDIAFVTPAANVVSMRRRESR